MKAVTIDAYGETPRLSEQPLPKVGPDSVLVRVRAAGLNPVDWHVAGGALDPMVYAYFPLTMGWDVAGVVERVGVGVSEFAVGDEVIAYNRQDFAHIGTWAEYTAVPVRSLAPKSQAMSWPEAGGLPLAGLTAYQALGAVHVEGGGTVLIHAAGGGVGGFATQIAASRGARVIGTTSRTESFPFLRELGAEPVLSGDGLAERVREMAPEGVDAALDFLGGDAVAVSAEVVKNPARIASVVDGSVKALGGRYVWVHPSGRDLRELNALAEAGSLRVHVNREFPLAEAQQAVELSRTGKVRGKIVLTVP
ncbi:NADP-dependent oxidoreductase [Streptacidiphilus pinicola]|uniref:NADP-dependent oxidoreductase n=1 Tax=Streptacidiphilus pinicola TaxID=2219663 RepID=A0A2X0IMN2_9ACTN|nr:NADP-dependent oxidoreductase [Streptacidiphilus pinicola]RAG84803.1 NADP-dependent oxidoreductase [Streptacidiphilus pinicola]